MSNLDVRVRNVSELNELEYGMWNQQAREQAERFLESVGRLSPDFQEQAAKWVGDLANQAKRTRFNNTPVARDEDTGRYVSPNTKAPKAGIFGDEEPSDQTKALFAPNEEDELIRLVEEYRARKQAAIDGSNPSVPAKPREFGDNVNDYVLAPGMQWAMRNNKMVQVPKHEAQPRKEFAPGTGSGMPTSPINGGVGNMAHLSPEQISQALAKRGNR